MAAGGTDRRGDGQAVFRTGEVGRMAVVKIIELVGSSKVSTDDAARQALNSARRKIRNIRAVDIVSTGLRGENLDEYRAHVRVAFVVESSEISDDVG